MASTTQVIAGVTINDGTKDTVHERVLKSIATFSKNGKRDEVSLAGGAFTALTVPTGAKGVLILCQDLTGPMTLKGVTGDTGIVTLLATAPSVPILVPLGTTPSIGILNSGATVTVDVIWF